MTRPAMTWTRWLGAAAACVLWTLSAGLLPLAGQEDEPPSGGDASSGAPPQEAPAVAPARPPGVWPGAPGSWVKIQWRRRTERGEDVYTVTQTVLKVEGNSVSIRFENSKGQTWEGGYVEVGEDGFGAPPSVEERVLREEEIRIGERAFPCRVIERVTRSSPLCGNDDFQGGVTTEEIWRCDTTTANGGVLRRRSRSESTYRSRPQEAREGTSEDVVDVEAPVLVGGTSWPCVVVELKTPGEGGDGPRVDRVWRCAGLPGGWARTITTGTKERENGATVLESEQQLLEFEIRK